MTAVLDAGPDARFHLDIGHANLVTEPGGDRAFSTLLRAFGGHLGHVHASDNAGDPDRHLPLGAGTIDWLKAARRLRATGYDPTVTLRGLLPGEAPPTDVAPTLAGVVARRRVEARASVPDAAG